jgi:hypothetical protein
MSVVERTTGNGWAEMMSSCSKDRRTRILHPRRNHHQKKTPLKQQQQYCDGTVHFPVETC